MPFAWRRYRNPSDGAVMEVYPTYKVKSPRGQFDDCSPLRRSTVPALTEEDWWAVPDGWAVVAEMTTE
jgi:hypothetical protein